MKERIKRFLPSFLQPMGSTIWLYIRAFTLFALVIVGLIPSHRVRLFLYRRVFGVRIGRYSTIQWQARWFEPLGVQIGDHSIIGSNAFLDGRSGLTIGNSVNTASEVSIYTLQHDLDDPNFGLEGAPVVIEDFVYIGPRAIILPGVTLGKGSVVAAGAVVTNDVPPFTVVGGVPAKFIRMRSEDLRYRPKFRMPFQ